jgi:hypothetical protein
MIGRKSRRALVVGLILAPLLPSDELIDLAGLLGSGQPVTAAGIAYCRQLLTDGHGPFYGFGQRPPLGQAIAHARALLDPYAEFA